MNKTCPKIPLSTVADSEYLHEKGWFVKISHQRWPRQILFLIVLSDIRSTSVLFVPSKSIPMANRQIWIDKKNMFKALAWVAHFLFFVFGFLLSGFFFFFFFYLEYFLLCFCKCVGRGGRGLLFGFCCLHFFFGGGGIFLFVNFYFLSKHPIFLIKFISINNSNFKYMELV